MNRHTYLLIECVPPNSSILCSPTIYRGVIRKGCHVYLAPMVILKTCVLAPANLRKKARNCRENYLCYTNLDFGTHGLEFLVTPLVYVLLVMICVQNIHKYVFYWKKSEKMPRHREDPKKVPYTLHHVLFEKKQQGRIGQKLIIVLMLSPRWILSVFQSQKLNSKKAPSINRQSVYNLSNTWNFNNKIEGATVIKRIKLDGIVTCLNMFKWINDFGLPNCVTASSSSAFIVWGSNPAATF